MTEVFSVPQEYEDFPRVELRAILQSVPVVLKAWDNLTTIHISAPVEGPAPLPLEFSVRSFGTSSVLLNVRTISETADLLSRNLNLMAIQPVTDEDIFKIFVNLLSSRLQAHLWGEGENVKMGEPFVSAPHHWPSRKPTVGCAFLVNNYPMEVRLWMDPR